MTRRHSRRALHGNIQANFGVAQITSNIATCTADAAGALEGVCSPSMVGAEHQPSAAGDGRKGAGCQRRKVLCILYSGPAQDVLKACHAC